MAESDSKGLIYEAFTLLAIEKSIGGPVLWEPNLPGVIAEQDLAYPSENNPDFVVGVTHWGSREAANKKFWRTMEDFFEVSCTFTKARFIHVLFEKNINSDDALDNLIRITCQGRALSIQNSENIPILQGYLRSRECINQFGKGKSNILYYCRELHNKDLVFKGAIDALGHQISSLLQIDDKRDVDNLIKKEQELAS